MLNSITRLCYDYFVLWILQEIKNLEHWIWILRGQHLPNINISYMKCKSLHQQLFFRINLQWIYQLSYNHSHFQSSRATSNLFYIVTSLKSGIHRFKWMTRDQNELGNARISGLYFMLMLILRFYEASSSQSISMHSRPSGLCKN